MAPSSPVDVNLITVPRLRRQFAAEGLAATRERDVPAGVAARNAATSTIEWRFTTAVAHITLKHRFPAVHA